MSTPKGAKPKKAHQGTGAYNTKETISIGVRLGHDLVTWLDAFAAAQRSASGLPLSMNRSETIRAILTAYRTDHDSPPPSKVKPSTSTKSGPATAKGAKKSAAPKASAMTAAISAEASATQRANDASETRAAK